MTKLLDMKVNRTLTKISEEEILRMAKELVAAIKGMVSLENALVDSPSEDQQFEILDEIEALRMDLDYESLALYVDGGCAPNAVLYRRGVEGLEMLKQVDEVTEKISDAYVPLTTEQNKGLKELLYATIASLAPILYFTFKLDTTEESLEAGKEVEMTLPIQSYVDNNSDSIEEVVALAKEAVLGHKPEVKLFELFPDLEDAFYDKAALYVQDFEALREYVTLDILKAVLEDDADIDKIISDLEQLAGQSEDKMEG